MIFFKMICDCCKKELKTLPLSEAIKNKKWWKQEIKNFGLNDILIIISIILIFSGLYFEFGPKIKNPCEFCKVNINDINGISTEINCGDWYKNMYEQNNDMEGKVDFNFIGDEYIEN